MTVTRRFRFFLRLLLGVVLLSVVASFLDLRQSLTLLMAASPLWLLAALGLLLVDRGAMAFKWNVLLRATGIRISFGRAFQLYLVGTLASSLLPSSLGGDAWRAYAAAHTPDERPPAFASVVVERVLGFAAILLIGAGTALLALTMGFGRVAMVALGVSGSGLVALVLLALLLRSGRLDRLGGKGRSGVLGRLPEALQAIAAYRDRVATLLLVLGLSIIEQLMAISVTVLLARAVGSSVPLVGFFTCVPVVSLLESLPISLGGLGVREGGYVALLSRFGMRPEAAFAISLLTQVATVVLCLPGALLMLARRTSSIESFEEKSEP